MPPNAARSLPRRDSTKPSVVPPPADHDSGTIKKSQRTPTRHETTAPFDASAQAPRTSEIRALSNRSSYRPPTPFPSPPLVPRASLADVAKHGEPRARRDSTLTRGFTHAPAPARRDPTPALAKSTAPPPPSAQSSGSIARPSHAPPALPPPTYSALQTTELPLEEIDYEAAYGYDHDALEARRERGWATRVARSWIGEARLRRSSSILPPALTDVANDVRASLAPEGRAEATRELRNMRRTAMRGVASLFRRAAAFFEARA